MKATLIIFSLFIQGLGMAAEPTKVAADFSKATNPFAEYNGVSGDAPKDDPLTTADYDQKNLDLTARIWADSEISQKLCKPVAETPPKTFVSWWDAVNKYVASEKTRNTFTKEKQAELKKKVDDPKPADYSFQTGSLLMQIEALNIMIDSLSGSSLSADGTPSQSTSRIGSREELLAAVLKAQESTILEDRDFNDGYNACLNGVDESLRIATEANKYATTECGKQPVTDATACTLKSTSNQMIVTSIPLFKKVPVVDLKELYTMAPVPSKEMNERLLKILSMMNQQIDIFFAKSPNPKYDWLKPLTACTAPMEKMVKATGIMCPTDAKDGKDYDKKTFDHLGRSDDFFDESAHYMVGQKDPTGTPTYLHTKLAYDKILAEVKADPKTKASSAKEIENIAMNKFWDTYVPSSLYSKNFIAGRDVSYGIDPAVAHQIAVNIMKENNQTEWTCSEAVCPTPLQPVVKVKPVIPDYAKVTASAKVFLDALGIKDALSDDMGVYLSEQWNSTDLIIGQSHHRQFYFKYVEDLLKSLIASDRSKLASLLLIRQTLLDNYNDLTKDLNAGTTIAETTKPTIGSSQETTTQPLPSAGGATQNKDLAIQFADVNLDFPTLGTAKVEEAGIAKASNGQMSYLGSGTLTGSNLGSANAINYSKTVNTAIKNSTDKIAALQKRKSSSQTASDKKAYDSFSKKMKTKVDGTKISSAGSILSKGRSASSSNNSTDANSGDAPPALIPYKDNYSNQGSSSGSSSSSGYSSYSGSSGSGSSSSSSGTSGSGNATSGTGAVSGAEGSGLQALNADQQKLNDAIGAKKLKDKEYEANEDDTIFSRVTKAYIRSYDRLK